MSIFFTPVDQAFSNLQRISRKWGTTENGDLPAADESLRCPQSRIRNRKRKTNFRFFESMGFHGILMRKKSFYRQNIVHTSNTNFAMAIFHQPSTTEEGSNARMFICCRMLSIIHCSANQSQRGKSCFRPSVHF